MKNFLLALLINLIVIFPSYAQNKMIETQWSLPPDFSINSESPKKEYHIILIQKEKSITNSNWSEVEPYVIAWQVLNVLDGASTLYCLNKISGCYEKNPLLGKHPSDKKVLTVLALGGIFHYKLSRELSKTSPEAVKWINIGSVSLKGFVISSNMKIILDDK